MAWVHHPTWPQNMHRTTPWLQDDGHNGACQRVDAVVVTDGSAHQHLAASTVLESPVGMHQASTLMSLIFTVARHLNVDRLMGPQSPTPSGTLIWLRRPVSTKHSDGELPSARHSVMHVSSDGAGVRVRVRIEREKSPPGLQAPRIRHRNKIAC